MYRQYSEGTTGRRLTMAEYRKYYATSNARKPRTCTGHNRVVYTAPDGSQRFMLHTTDVAVLNADGTITLNDGGWPTMTTRRAMAEGITELTGLNIPVHSGDKVHDHCVGRRLHFNGSVTFDPQQFAA